MGRLWLRKYSWRCTSLKVDLKETQHFFGESCFCRISFHLQGDLEILNPKLCPMAISSVFTINQPTIHNNHSTFVRLEFQLHQNKTWALCNLRKAQFQVLVGTLQVILLFRKLLLQMFHKKSRELSTETLGDSSF